MVAQRAQCVEICVLASTEIFTNIDPIEIWKHNWYIVDWTGVFGCRKEPKDISDRGVRNIYN